MPDKRLYTIIVPEEDQETIGSSQNKRMSQKPTLSTDYGDVQETGSNPGSLPLVGVYKAKYAELMARQLSELARATYFNEVPYYAIGGSADDVYVTVESFSIDPYNSRQDVELWQFDGSLVEEGTIDSHWRAMETTPDSIDNPFSTGSTDYVGIPTTATKVRWYDETGQQLSDATNQGTVSNKHLNVDRYSPDEASFIDPTLIFKVPYGDEGKMDSRVWDDYDRSQFDSDNINSWQKVFATGHVFQGDAVIENGRLRLTLDEDGESMSFEEWDSGTSSYSSVSLGSSNWVLSDFNFTRISPARVEGQIRFRDTSNGNLHTLDFQVNRAYDRVTFITPTNQGAIPSGLDTKLSPIASTVDTDTQPIQTILARKEVND